MIKRAINLPFVVLGSSRAPSRRGSGRNKRPWTPGPPRRGAATQERTNIPGYDVPDDFDAGDVEVKARDVAGWTAAGHRPFVDVRARRTLCIPGSQHLPPAARHRARRAAAGGAPPRGLL